MLIYNPPHLNGSYLLFLVKHRNIISTILLIHNENILYLNRFNIIFKLFNITLIQTGGLNTMIIWNRLGFLAPLIAMTNLVLAEYLTEEFFNDTNYYQEHGWPMLLAFLISGRLCLVIGRSLNKKQEKLYSAVESGKKIIIKPRHTFFFISLEHWGFLFPLFGIIMDIIVLLNL